MVSGILADMGVLCWLFLAVIFFGKPVFAVDGDDSSRDIRGQEFIFSIPRMSLWNTTAVLVATAQTPLVPTDVHVKIPDLEFSRRKRIGYLEVARFQFSVPMDVFTLQQRKGLVCLKSHYTVIVQASADVTLQCALVDYTDIFVVFPTDALGVDYFISSSPHALLRHVTVSTTRNGTNVTFTPVRGAFHIHEHSDGTEVLEDLEKACSVHMWSRDDLTGVRVSSNFPVSVLTGSENNLDVTIHQLSPVVAWGRSFVLAHSGFGAPPFDLPIYRIVAPYPNTSLTITSGGIVIDVNLTPTGSRWYDHSFPSADAVNVLSSNKAVMVVRYTSASALLIAPTEQYSSRGVAAPIPLPSFLDAVSYSADVLVNVAYFCRDEHTLTPSDDPPGSVSVVDKRSHDATYCVKCVLYRFTPSGNDEVIDIRLPAGVAMFLWVEILYRYPERLICTLHVDRVAFPVAMLLKRQPCVPGQHVSKLCRRPEGLDERIHSMATMSSRYSNWTGALSTAAPPATSDMKGSSEVTIIASLSALVAIFLCIIARLCYTMKKNKMLPCFPPTSPGPSGDIPLDAGVKTEAPPTASPVFKRNSIGLSLPDLRPIVAPTFPMISQEPRFIHIRPIAEEPSAPDTGDNRARRPPSSDIHLNQHRTFQQVRHSYFNPRSSGAFHRPKPSVPRVPNPHIYQGVGRDDGPVTAAARASLGVPPQGQFASIGRRQAQPAKPSVVQYVALFQKPEDAAPTVNLASHRQTSSDAE